MEQIVCLSTSNFYPYPTRKQNVMLRLPDAEILYFDPPVSYIAPLKDKKARERLKKYRDPGERAGEHITVYALPPVLPFGQKWRWINRLNQRKLARYIRRRMRQHGYAKPLLWCYSPASADIAAHLPHTRLVYDCVDRHSAYRGLLNPKLVDTLERELARRADMVFCTAQGLYQTLKAYNPRTYLIPNGADFDLFSQAAGDNPNHDPAHPVFGFVGMLQDCLAYDCLLALADAYPKGEIRLIGRLMPGVDIAALRMRKNIRLLGLLPQSELPRQMRDFDVCLNIFDPGKLSQDVSPLKFYEYLATGKPVVSTKEPRQVADYADLIYIADSPGDFVAKCALALAEADPEKTKGRLAAGLAASWDNRVRQMVDKLREMAIFTQQTEVIHEDHQ
ncbi:MAG: glycosyltransferase family 1 protein [Clostridia bacterium]|nr:glycosyltransferase family 1 protein [Clostridia bacterium]